MTSFTIEVKDTGVHAALASLIERVEKPRPVLQQIGEGIIERAKQRFPASTGPDGQRWASNSRATIEAFIAKRGGIGKRGKITKKGIGLATSKKPLIGESHDLSRQFHLQVSDGSVSVANTMIYAAIQQFGAKKGEFGSGKKRRFPIPWGDIPARPFMPIHADGSLYNSDRDAILADLNRYFDAA